MGFPITPMTFVRELCVGTRYNSRSWPSVGWPGADSAPERSAPKVRKLPNFAAKRREVCPASPIPSTTVASAPPLAPFASRRSFSSRATCVMSVTMAAILTMSAPAATHRACVSASAASVGTVS